MEDVGPDLFVCCAANLNSVTWEDIVCFFSVAAWWNLFVLFAAGHSAQRDLSQRKCVCASMVFTRTKIQVSWLC